MEPSSEPSSKRGGGRLTYRDVPANKRLAMSKQRRANTDPEVELRRHLHALGMRFRLHRPIVPGTRRKVDIVMSGPKVAVDVRGCFWHGCTTHGALPKRNAVAWSTKLATNRARDLDTAQRLADDGWKLVVVWEHDDMAAVALEIASIVKQRRRRLAPSHPRSTIGSREGVE